MTLLRSGIANRVGRWKRALRLRTRLVDAVFRLRRQRGGLTPLNNWRIDRRYGGWCGGIVRNPSAHPDASRSQSCDYRTLRELFRGVEITPHDVLVDVGCGKGRVINYWLSRSLPNRMIGIELLPEVAQWARARLRRFANVEVVTGDVLGALPKDGTLYFMYNPFGLTTMRAFADAAARNGSQQKPLRIIYLNPQAVNAFSATEWRIESLRTSSPDGAVMITRRVPPPLREAASPQGHTLTKAT